jgi:hypothetical protein
MLSVIQSACRSLTDEDLQQEFIVILLTSATRYRVNKPFCSYFGMTFLYETAQVVKHLLRDPVTTSAQPLTDNIPYDALEDMLGPEELDENWVQGKTCSEIFSGLTSFEGCF